MKYLPGACLFFWLVPMIGKQHLPDFFGMSYIQWPAFVILSILLPYGFAKSIKNCINQHFSILFLLIFLCNIFITGVGGSMFNSIRVTFSAEPLLEENISLAAINHDKAEIREITAQTIYRLYGQPIMYKDTLNKVAIYTPTKKDSALFQERYTQGSKSKELIRHANFAVLEMTYFFIIACGTFFVIFLSTFFFEQIKANKFLKRN